MINLHQLEVFHTVARCESYSRAAERLEISQPAVSMQVARLEETLGVSLVVMKGRQVVLTEAGQALAAYAGRILALSAEALAAMADFRTARRGRIRLGASTTPGAYLLPSVVQSFRQEFPGVDLTLAITNTGQALRALSEGALDLAVVGEVPEELAGDLEVTPLCPDRLVVVVAPGHPWSAVPAIRPADLAAEPLVLREEGSSTRRVLDERLRPLGLKPKVAMELPSTEAIKQAVGEGLGAAVLSAWAIRWEVESRRLVRVPVEGIDLSRMLHLVTVKGGQLPAAAERFVAHLRGHARVTEARPILS